MTRSVLFSATLCALSMLAFAKDPAPKVITFNDDGGWCWFEDERVLVDDGKLIIGSIASGTHEPSRKGDVEVTSYDLTSRKKSKSTLHHSESAADQKRWMDDHNSPAFLVRPDGRLLTMYSRHGTDEKILYRISDNPKDATTWGNEQVYVPTEKSRVTYSNLHLLSRENNGKGRIYEFFRGLDNSFKPSYAYSDDFGQTWIQGNVFIDVPAKFRHRPYVKYASNGVDTIHITYTDGHPRDFDNSVYHVFYRDGKLHKSDGTVIRSLAEGLRTPDEGTRIFQGDPNNVGWMSDVHLDSKGHPYVAYSVQKDSAGLPDGKAGEDLRYRLARWNGTKWTDHEIAYAGHKLYPGEDDYTGNIALDPHNPNEVYISTNADPLTGKPLSSKADNQRHWELYRGVSEDGVKFAWTPLTHDSKADNIRPIVPIWPGNQIALLWLRGKMRSYTDFTFEVVGALEKRR